MPVKNSINELELESSGAICSRVILIVTPKKLPEQSIKNYLYR